MKADDTNVGDIIRYDNKVCRVTEKDLHGHGKVARTIHMKLKELETGNVIEQNFKTGETVETVDAETTSMEYSYPEDDFYVFMHPETYEQVRFNKKILGEKSIFLQENSKLKVTFVDGQPISVDFPETVTLKVTSAPEGVKGSDKEVELENGLKLLVPHFITDTDSVVVKIEDASYVERVTTKSMGSGGAVPGTGGGEKSEE